MATRFGPYEVERLVGEGARAEVFLARGPDGRAVAVKVLKAEFAALRDERARFVREARHGTTVVHPNVVSVVAVVDEGERPWLAMDYVAGRTLKDLLAERPPLSLVLSLGAQVADALAAAHAEGIVHRDLKPSNVMVDRDGMARVADWGLSKALDDDARLTADGTLLGTPLYMAPEVVSGRPASPRSDLYALGVILYEATTGSLPFTGATIAAVLQAHLGGRPPRPARLVPDLPLVFDGLVMALLARDPAERPGSADEVAVTLRTLAAGCGVVADRPEEPPTVNVDGSKALAGPAVTQPSRPVDRALPAAPPTTQRTERSKSPARRDLRPLAALVCLVLVAGALALVARPRPSPSAPGSAARLREPRFVSTRRLMIPVAGPVEERLRVRVDGRAWQVLEVAPLVQRQSLTVWTVPVDLDGPVPWATTVVVDVGLLDDDGRVMGPVSPFTVPTPTVPDDVERVLDDLAAFDDATWADLSKAIDKAGDDRRLRTVLERAMGPVRLGRLAEFLPGLLTDGVAPCSPLARRLAPLQYIAAWNERFMGGPPLPWPDVSRGLGIHFRRVGRGDGPSGYEADGSEVELAFLRAVAQYPLPSARNPAVPADKVWLATSAYIASLVKSPAAVIAAATNARIDDARRPPIEDFMTTVSFDLPTRARLAGSWPPHRARLAVRMTCFVREFVLLVGCNGHPPIPVPNCENSQVVKGQNSWHKAMVVLSVALDPSWLQQVNNRIELTAGSLPGVVAADAVGIDGLKLFVSGPTP